MQCRCFFFVSPWLFDPVFLCTHLPVLPILQVPLPARVLPGPRHPGGASPQGRAGGRPHRPPRAAAQPGPAGGPGGAPAPGAAAGGGDGAGKRGAEVQHRPRWPAHHRHRQAGTTEPAVALPGPASCQLLTTCLLASLPTLRSPCFLPYLAPYHSSISAFFLQEIPMMRIVAEMMIFANAAVGQRVAAAFPRSALLRRHPPPRKESFEEASEQRAEGRGAGGQRGRGAAGRVQRAEGDGQQCASWDREASTVQLNSLLLPILAHLTAHTHRWQPCAPPWALSWTLRAAPRRCLPPWSLPAPPRRHQWQASSSRWPRGQ